MKIHEYGAEHSEAIVLLHPLGVRWDIFSEIVPILEKSWHLVIPVIPGHDPDDPKSEFTSVEEIASELEKWLRRHGLGRVKCLYGCSMGGAVVTRMLANHRVGADVAVIDGGITPYDLPKAITWLIGVRDWAVTEIGKHAGPKALRGMFPADKYSEEDLKYVKETLRGMSSRTIWRSFYSTNNYTMPKRIPPLRTRIQYWYGEEEAKVRKEDIAYIRKNLTTAEIVEKKGVGHAEYFTLHPEAFCHDLEMLLQEEEPEFATWEEEAFAVQPGGSEAPAEESAEVEAAAEEPVEVEAPAEESAEVEAAAAEEPAEVEAPAEED